MKVYLAAPYAGRDILKEHLPIWVDAGHEVTCGWVKGTRPLETASFGTSETSTDEEVYVHATDDLADIAESDVLVHYTADYLKFLLPGLTDAQHNLHSGGRHVETGFALAREIPVVVIGKMENIFQRGLCLSAFDVSDAVEVVEMFVPNNEGGPRGH